MYGKLWIRFTSGEHALYSAVLFNGGMRIQHFVVLSFVLWLTLATGEAQFSNECFPAHSTGVVALIRQPQTVALSETGRTIGFWATMLVTAIGLVSICCWLPRGMSGWDAVMARFPDVPVVSGARVKPYAFVGIGGFSFSRGVTLKLTSSGIHVRPPHMLTPQVFIPYSAIQRIVIYSASKCSTLVRVAYGSAIRDVYDLIVEYPVHFEITLSADDFEFVRPFVPGVSIVEAADEPARGSISM